MNDDSESLELVPLSSKWSLPYDAAKFPLVWLVSLIPWALLLFLGGCAPKLSNEWFDSIAIERARTACQYAGVPVADLPACIMRDVAARRESQTFGAWSPI